ncbi:MULTISPECIES: RdgB/HAM1 family non-canonical purine NTP pyrophosphatase [Chromobacterium]|uniref:dITP/XTP pyrophosphatase n=1 Tax=Chromobacterium rhizoryzae TaxID=1778675 RepID=A0AAD0RVS9_9NEIS|nr:MULTISPECIES: RdgB/HAM1 family non-canonical purine NTP pyrophosphatase [Chromobacterium]AXT47956.1 RdgB/HAM1 family non-canonical purine NTP pyrophosphatase [Chromobacterium rhizoryzae]MDH0342337.1 RdgB/HAM1 family non-canonical purine NTP pyrophosphatase [Chromobacterium haemolyticum]PTU68399.1 non-canonical purine NTP pyrophosphatase, RdgB/HAM1 family [Chromobacterium haemolyticum]QOD81849.1 RdgB/HAM1 family non-canonical purine NTP pyrophosphatase [Chromobacterium haemolyticum]BBH14423.
MFDKLVMASNNVGKLKEFSSLLAPLGIQVIPQVELQVPECPEPHHTFLENALEKARHASRMTGLPALADDSGICVEALSGAPGVYSARYAGEPKSDAANNAKLVAALQGEANRRAWYYCVLVLVRHADDPQPLVADGMWFGEVRDEAAGAGGFGYDPHFWLPQHGCSVAELDAAEKNRVSHRGQAMQALLAKLRALA